MEKSNQVQFYEEWEEETNEKLENLRHQQEELKKKRLELNWKYSVYNRDSELIKYFDADIKELEKFYKENLIDEIGKEISIYTELKNRIKMEIDAIMREKK